MEVAVMKFRCIPMAMAFAVATSFVAAAQPMSANDIQDELTAAGYTQVRDINFGAEAITAKAVKDGKEWRLVIDSQGKVLQQRQE
jgi:hypothetical protein